MSTTSTIRREHSELVGVVIATTLADTQSIPYGNFPAGEIFVPVGSTITSLTWYASRDGVTFLAAYDSAASPAAVTQTVAAGRAYPIPAALAGVPYLKAVGNQTGTVDVAMKG